MDREVKTSHLGDALDELEYPIDRAPAAETFADTTLLLADGEINLGDAIANTPSDQFDTADDLVADLYAGLPREAVGEPYQSEGDA